MMQQRSTAGVTVQSKMGKRDKKVTLSRPAGKRGVAGKDRTRGLCAETHRRIGPHAPFVRMGHGVKQPRMAQARKLPEPVL